MYQLEQISYFYLLVAIPVILAVFVLALLWKKRTQQRFADKSALAVLSPDRSSAKPVLKTVLLCLAVACLTMALVNPRVGTRTETIKREGVDIVFAIDVSKSMEAEDVAPNRLERSKQLVTRILDELHGDRVGLIGYAGSAFPQLPITTDYSAARMFLRAMHTDMVSSQGTAIAEAVRLAETYFDDEDQTNRILVIVSDGEDHEGNFEQLATQGAEKGIKIVAIGVGTSKGSLIPIKRGSQVVSYMQDRDGERVITRLDEQVLRQLASMTGGAYLSGNNTGQAVEGLKDYLDQADKTTFETREFAGFKSQFQWFVAGALLFLLLDVFLLEIKTSWIRRLNLFNEKRDA